MTRFVQSRKEAPHERMLQAATRAIRRSGPAGPGVADSRRKAGLTHGGFHAHVASREALLAEAAVRAGAEIVSALEQFASAVPPSEAYRTRLKTCLSRAHVEPAETGCPVAALGSEMARHAPDGRTPDGRRKALATTATLIGTLTLARAVDDRPLSDELPAAALERLTGE